ncbi:NUDIX domain-containing protein [Epibacterium ulvae]|uniref:NUDIX domain-containing protein n=1 Tax=Epibacterium ulvae TaxID=1156985 RepID=UPI0024935540|nr:NUDIX domain-containing protein [Epibacterium ulvae]
MFKIFICGPLCERPLLEQVLGRAVSGVEMTSAVLPDYQLRCADGANAPILGFSRGEQTFGVLFNATDSDQACLSYYLEATGHLWSTATVVCSAGASQTVEIYTRADTVSLQKEPWQASTWRETWFSLTLRAAEEIMAYHGQKPASEVAGGLIAIHLRAAAWVDQKSRPENPAHPLSEHVRVHARKRPYMNFFALEEIDFQHRRYDGTWSETMNRASFLVGQAAAILPYDPIRDEVLLVEQFRAATYIAGETNPWMWEPVAGLIDPGETPEQAARREALEEAGIVIEHLDSAGRTYSSSGASGELVYLFVGTGSLENVAGGGGLASEGEDIRRQILSFDALMEGVDKQRYQDMPLVATALWLARHRDRIRANLQ